MSMHGRLVTLKYSFCALIAGALLILALAPFGFSIIQILCVAFLFHLILKTSQVQQSFFVGWAFGTGWMTASVYWLFFSMHQYGGLNPLLAILAVIILGLFMGLLPATAITLTKFIGNRLQADNTFLLLFILPATLTLAEWTRGWLFTGLPWGALGYAHTDNALSGFAPLIGVYGITLLATFLSGCVIVLLNRKYPYRSIVFVVALTIIIGGYGLKFINWTIPVNSPIKIRLLQGNIPQELKFSPEQSQKTLKRYEDMIMASPADLIVTPETAIPQYLHTLSPAWYKKLEKYVVDTKTTLAIGIPIADSLLHYTNSLIVISPETSNPYHISYRYNKQHLVPFGEYIPSGFRWFLNLMHIPLGNFARGPIVQKPFLVKNQWIMPNICYEDLFGEEIAKQIKAAYKSDMPEPGIMLNISNIAWFGNSLALPQHLQISRMRALEMQRPMLRSTNTGVTAIIDAKGQVQGELPYYRLATLETEIQGMNGITPYIRFGNHIAITACLILFFAGATLAHYRLTRSPTYRSHPLSGRNDWEEL